MNRHNTLPFSFVSSLLSLNHLQPRASNLVPKSIMRLVPLTLNTSLFDLFLWISEHKYFSCDFLLRYLIPNLSLPLQPVPGVVGRPITDRGRDPTAWIYAQWVTTAPYSRLQSATIEQRGRGYYIYIGSMNSVTHNRNKLLDSLRGATVLRKPWTSG